jgi:uncharacterized protein (DUF1800 family)
METLTSCNTASLAIYTDTAANPWDIQKVRHTLRRLGYGLNQAQEAIAMTQVPDVFIENYINTAANYAVTPAPSWAFWGRSDYTNFNTERTAQIQEWYTQVFNDTTNLNFRARMTLFWHNHFVTRLEDYNAPSWMYQYYNLLQTHALGNFKTLVKEMGKNESMLVFLNGVWNNKFSPNENYARELLELFTLGENNNYTQTDIVEAARALTGYNNYTEIGAPIVFQQVTFDDTSKTIFGTAANYNHDTLIDHLFAVRASEISDFIVKKIYSAFVSPELPAQSIIDQLALTFRNANWEVLPVVKQLFKSEHFFDPEASATVIKDPLDCLGMFIKEANFTFPQANLNTLFYYSSILGQQYFNPIDVAGWQGDRDWINSSTITGRWQAQEYIMWTMWNIDQELFRTIALDASLSMNDPDAIARDIIDRFVSKSLYTASDYALATTVFKGDVPENYYTNMQWDLNWGSVPYQVILLLQHIFRMPEFQLK